MFGLSFLSPLYLLGALAVALPIALHLFRRRTDTVVDFPAVRLLHATPVQQQRRRRLREIILLALRVTALILLAGAFARPYLAGAALPADTPVTVVALDTSFSLSAPTIFTRARQVAAEAVREAPAGHAVAVVAFADAATTLVEPTTDRAAAAAAVEATRPGASTTRYAAAVARASDVIGGREGRLVVVTDLQQAGWTTPAGVALPDDVPVEVRTVEAPLANVAVTGVTRRAGRVAAEVHNFGFDPRDVTARLHVTAEIEGGAPGSRVFGNGPLPPSLAEARVNVPARSATEVVFDVAVPSAGAAVVAVDDAEGFAADNARYLVLDPPVPVRVTVVVADPTALRGGLYVERALEAAGEQRRFAVTVVDGRALSAWPSDRLRAEDALLVLGTRTLERRGRELVSGYVADGGSLLVAAGPDVDPATLADVIGVAPGVSADAQAFRPAGATLVVADVRHPVFRPFAAPEAALGDVLFERYRALDEQGRAVLARFSGGAAALVELPRPRGRLLLFASDLDNQWNRFPLSPAFVPFLVEAVAYLTEGTQPPREWLLPAVPPSWPASPGVFVLPEAQGGGAGRVVAVNVDARESNPAPTTGEAFLAAVPREPRSRVVDPEADARQAEDEQRLWQLGLLLMFAALAGEGLVGRRAV